MDRHGRAGSKLSMSSGACFWPNYGRCSIRFVGFFDVDDIHLFVSDTYFDPENRVLTSLAESLAGSAGRPFAADLSVGDQMLVPAHVDQNFDSTIGRLGTPLRGYQQ